MNKLCWLAAAFSMAAMVSACGGGGGDDAPPPPTPATLSTESLTHANTARSYLKYTPQALPTSAVPLVIVLHGGSDDAATAASSARGSSVWRSIADREKFLLAYPDGIANQWRDCRSDATLRTSADDVGFIDALITRLAAERAIDLSRVYVTGASNGGMMSYRLAQELPNRIAGVGAVIANLPVDPQSLCRPANTPMTMVIMNGTLDALMPYAGGVVALNADSGTVRGSLATRDRWAAVNGCTGAPTSQSLPDLDASDGITVTQQSYANCSAGTRLVYFALEGGGHTMPSRVAGEGARQGRDIEGAEEIWRVLKDARR
jgi:polyhydroxybutyrate depolymerase